MKLLSCILLLGCLQLSAGMSAQGISLSSSNASLPAVFAQIEQQTSFKFIYSSEKILAATKVSITVQNASLEQVLELCFKDQPLTYVIEERFVVVKLKELKNSNATPADNDVHGMVRNDKDEPIGGATVMIKGTRHAVPTDSKGAFVITNVPPGAILRISSIGYESQEILIGNNRMLVIHLETSVNALDEMVIKGYYTTSKRLNTGSVSKVTAEEIARQPIANPLAALEGKMAGVYIQQTSGIPGGNFNIQIRGQNSLRATQSNNGNLPLYIVDGVPFSGAPINATISGGALPQLSSPLNYLNPADIESIEVLKDADATSIYGSRGANGVVLITTKKGKQGDTRFDLNVYEGAGKLTRKMNLLNTPQYLQMRKEALKNDGLWPLDLSLQPSYPDLFNWDTTRYTDWQKTLIGGTSQMTNMQASVSGGTEHTQFIVGGGYSRETTVSPGDFADKKGSAHFSINHISTNEKLRIQLTGSYVADNNNLFNTDFAATALTLAPNAPALYDSSGNLNWQNSTWSNPLSALRQRYKSNTDNLISNALFSYTLFKGLALRTSLGYTTTHTRENTAYPLSSMNPAYVSISRSSAGFATSQITTWIIEPQAEYQFKRRNSKFDIIVGTTFQQNVQDQTVLNASGFASDLLIDNVQAATSLSKSYTYAQYRYNAIFGRVNYNLKDKYLLNLTGRRDGSSRFGPDRQFANFGAAGAAWIFSSEQWAKSLPLLSFGKFRVSYGSTGSDQIGDYQYLDTYSTTPNPYQSTGGLIPTRLLNPDYSWEINTKLDAAAELGFFKDRLLIGINWFYNKSGNQLVGYPLPVITGNSSIQFNLPATVINKGWEFEVNTINMNSPNFRWTTGFNLTIPRNKLTAYPNLASSSYAYMYAVGKPLYIRNTFQFEGVNPQTGIYQFLRQADHSLTTDPVFPADFVFLKSVAQQYYGGIVNNLKYKKWQLDISLQFVNQTGFNYMAFYQPPGAMSNQPADVMNRWQQPGDNANIQRFTTTGTGTASYSNNQASDNIIGGASFIRCKNVSLSYEFSGRKTKKALWQNLKIFIQGQNLFTITHYQNLDPENPSGTPLLPPLRVITGGIHLTL